ncbi:MAG: cytochrome c peroxidase [Saprospiraceae bacterium]
MNRFLILFFAFAISLMVGCSSDKEEQAPLSIDQNLEALLKSHSQTGEVSFYVMPSSNDFANIPNQDPKNPITYPKVALGNSLFFETGIGMAAKKSESMATYSCSTCHVPEVGFTAGRFQGIADGGVGFGYHGEKRLINNHYEGHEVDAQGARPLPVINLAYVKNALWNGSFGSTGMNVGTESVWGVADSLTLINRENREGLEAAITRALTVHRQVINKKMIEDLGYKGLFDNAFADVPESQRYTPQNASHAIAAYFRTILTNQAPFQEWLRGNKSAMTEKQKRGAVLFFDKAGCVNCHNSPSLNGQRFAAIGVKDLDQSDYLVYKTNDGRSKGRASFTLKDEDLYRFKVPELYNLKDVGFYFHGASKRSLREVVEYFNQGQPENSRVESKRIDGLFRPLNLTDSEVADLTEFLSNGLFDPNMLRYKPIHTNSGNCFPNADPSSMIDLGCN